MEYVGEVLDTKGFRKRAKRYARDDVLHFYFMALSVSTVNVLQVINIPSELLVG